MTSSAPDATAATTAPKAPPKFSSVREELAAYREVHRRLTAELLRSTDDVRRLQIQRRHLLEEIMGNIRRDGGYFPGTTWAKQAQNYAKRSQAEWTRRERQRKVDQKRAASARRHRDRLDRVSSAAASSQKIQEKAEREAAREAAAAAAVAARQLDPGELQLAQEIGLPAGWTARSSKNGTYTIYSPTPNKRRFMSKKAAYDFCGIGVPDSQKPAAAVQGTTNTNAGTFSNAAAEDPQATIAAAEAAARAAAASMLAMLSSNSSAMPAGATGHAPLDIPMPPLPPPGPTVALPAPPSAPAAAGAAPAAASAQPSAPNPPPAQAPDKAEK